MSHYQNFKICEDAAQKVDEEDNICYHIAALVLGILTIFISIFWTLHIILYMVWVDDPPYGFLNVFLVELDKAWDFLGVTFYGIFAFYLMLCVVKGNAKWGLSIGICSLHKLEPGNTLMQSFLVNTLLLALCSFSVVQFCMQAFKGYAGPNSASTAIFNVAARHLKGITYLYTHNVFVYILLCTALLSFMYLCCCPPKHMDMRQQLKGAIDEDGSRGLGKGSNRLAKNVEVQMEERGFNNAV